MQSRDEVVAKLIKAAKNNGKAEITVESASELILILDQYQNHPDFKQRSNLVVLLDYPGDSEAMQAETKQIDECDRKTEAAGIRLENFAYTLTDIPKMPFPSTIREKIESGANKLDLNEDNLSTDEIIEVIKFSKDHTNLKEINIENVVFSDHEQAQRLLETLKAAPHITLPNARYSGEDIRSSNKEIYRVIDEIREHFDPSIAQERQALKQQEIERQKQVNSDSKDSILRKLKKYVELESLTHKAVDLIIDASKVNNVSLQSLYSAENIDQLPDEYKLTELVSHANLMQKGFQIALKRIQAIKDPGSKLDLQSLGLDASHVAIISELIKDNSNISSIDLSGNHIGYLKGAKVEEGSNCLRRLFKDPLTEIKVDEKYQDQMKPLESDTAEQSWFWKMLGY